MDSSVTYPKCTQMPTINLKKKKADATKYFLGGALNYSADLRKRKSETEQWRNTEKLCDDVFSDLFCNAMCEIAEEFQEDMLIMNVLRLIYTTKYQQKEVQPNSLQPLRVSPQTETLNSPSLTDRFNS